MLTEDQLTDIHDALRKATSALEWLKDTCITYELRCDIDFPYEDDFLALEQALKDIEEAATPEDNTPPPADQQPLF